MLVFFSVLRLRRHTISKKNSSRGQVVVDWVDVLWSNEDAEFIAVQGKSIDRKSPPVTFVVSYNVVVVDEWIKKAVKGVPGPW